MQYREEYFKNAKSNMSKRLKNESREPLYNN